MAAHDAVWPPSVPRATDLVLDRRSSVPLYRQLTYHILHLVTSGAWPAGMLVPSVRQMADDLGLATATVQRVYGDLQAQGVLTSQVGRGMFVADAAEHPSEVLAPETSLRRVVGRAVAHAHALGFSEEQILEAVRGALAAARATGAGRIRRLLFVGATRPLADKYRTLLAEAFADLDLNVESTTLDALRQSGAAGLEDLDSRDLLVTLVGTAFTEVRRLARRNEIPHYGLVVDLTEETEHALIHLPDDAPTGLIAEEPLLPSARTLLRHYRGTEEGVPWAELHNATAVRRVLQECPVVIYTLSARESVLRKARPGTRLVELEYRPNPMSIRRLRAMLVRPVGTAAEGASAGKAGSVSPNGRHP